MCSKESAAVPELCVITKRVLAFPWGSLRSSQNMGGRYPKPLRRELGVLPAGKCEGGTQSPQAACCKPTRLSRISFFFRQASGAEQEALDRSQGLIEIGDDVLYVLNAYGDADHAIG